MERMLIAAAVFTFVAAVAMVAGDEAKSQKWSSHQMAELLKKRAESKRAYLPFLDAATLHCGVYVLARDATDRQNPHDQDEVYYTLKGQAKLKVGSGDESKDLEVTPGAVLFVAAGVEHRFHSITEDVELLVFFSKAKPE